MTCAYFRGWLCLFVAFLAAGCPTFITGGVDVPNVVGLTQEAAETAITDAGLTVGQVTQASSNTVPSGQVASQNPAAGANVSSGTAVNLVISQGPSSVTVPDVSGMTRTAAEAALESEGLALGAVTEAASDTVPSGNVISQDPLAGATVASGTVVSLVLSTGPEQASVPNLVGRTEASASAVLEAAGLVTGTVTRESSDTVPDGEIIRQTPAADTSVNVGSSVDFVVSTGPELVSVPDVVGMAQGDAESAITGAGLTVGAVTEVDSTTVNIGDVISQDPEAGAQVDPQTTVALTVSLGIEIPDVTGMTQAEAEAAITGAGLTVGAITEVNSDTVNIGDVISQDPEAGTQANPQAAVALTVSLGIEVPDVTGMTQAQAETALTDAGLTVGAVTEEFNSSVAIGDVITQDPMAGALAEPGAAVALAVSLGIEVPNVVGMSRNNAEAAIEAAGLTVTVRLEFDPDATEGQVASQDPGAGSGVDAGTVVELVVYTNSEVEIVPVLDGLTRSAAEATLDSTSFVLGTVTDAYSDTVPEGEVFGQNPAGNETVAIGTTVTFSVSLGVEPGRLPTASFGASKVSGEVPLEITFSSAESTPGAFPISGYQWNFGDGGTSTEPDPTHVYTTPGTFTVSLEVSNSIGSDTESKSGYTVAVEVLDPPVAPDPYPATAEVEFNDNPVDANVIADSYPFTVTGAIAQDIDGDYFAFTAAAGDVITAALTTDAAAFDPSLSFANAAGSGIQSVAIDTAGNGQYTTAISAIISTDGTYYLIVNDFNSSGDPSFTYAVDVFKDSDSDGLEDAIETAYGSNPGIADSDGDDVIDGTEFHVYDTEGRWRPDFDGDGTSNWDDTDSDNDGLPDQVEGTGDADKDGLANFTDFDSDGNGLDDRLEAGLNRSAPQDIDLDGSADFEDIDNDGDSVWDIFDAQPSLTDSPADVLDSDGPIALLSAIVDFGDGNTLDGAARAGDTLTLEGRGFSDTPEENIVLFRSGNQALNILPATASTSALTVQVPDGSPAPEQVAVYAGDALSNWVSLRIVSGTNPVLFESQELAGGTGETLVLAGVNLANVTTVNFGGIQADASFASDFSVEAVIPVTAMSGDLSVVSATGVSNPVSFKVTTPVGGEVALPTNKIDLDQLVVNWGVFGEGVPGVDGSITSMAIDNSELDAVFVLLPETADQPETVLFQALTLPSDADVVLDVESTAVAFTMTAVQVEQLVSFASLADARTLITGLPEVQSLAVTIETALQADPYALADPDSAYHQALFDATIAANEAILDALDQGVLTAKRSARALQPLIEGTTGGAEKDLQPVITPKQSDVSVHRIDDTGNVRVENDTQLYLSARFEDSQTGAELVSHISSYFDSEMIGPQGFGLFFLANSKDFNQPQYRNCRIEVVTPGRIAPTGNLTVTDYLALRTFVDRVILPLVNFAVGLNVNASELTKILIDKAGPAVNTFGTLLNSGDVKGAFKAIGNALFEDAFSAPPGPITQALAKRFGKNLGQQALDKLAKKIGAKLVPGLGQISFAIELIGAVNTGANVGKTAADFRETPGLLVFEVEWPLEVTGIAPEVIRAESVAKDITIAGQGFAPFTTGFGFWEEVHGPEVHFNDTGTGNSIVIEPNSSMITNDGTRMIARLPASYVESAQGPIDITVFHNDLEAMSPVQLRVVTELEITSLDPAEGAAGTIVNISGAGFHPDRFQNTVTFAGVNGTRLFASVLSVDSTSIRVIVPQGVVSGPVQVEAFGEMSNTLDFEVVDLEVLIDFGDNGSANDDTYALFVDGTLIHSMPVPTRNAGPFSLNLGEGLHSVTLRGITAPDAIGTYFISFGGNVLSVTGDALTGSDLTAGVEKHYTIEVGPTSKTPSKTINAVPPGILWAE